jgi:hypothetical protein
LVLLERAKSEMDRAQFKHGTGFKETGNYLAIIFYKLPNQATRWRYPYFQMQHF